MYCAGVSTNENGGPWAAVVTFVRFVDPGSSYIPVLAGVIASCDHFIR
jgi:hypothetical protein